MTIASTLQATRTCAGCKHYTEAPVDPLNLGAPRQGECRGNPPGQVVLPMGGGLAIRTQYPQVTRDFPACRLYEVGLTFAPT
jgi:hypothetical protein